MISISWSLSRQHHGEHTFWDGDHGGRAMLGQIGLPGGGIAFGNSTTNWHWRPQLPKYQGLFTPGAKQGSEFYTSGSHQRHVATPGANLSSSTAVAMSTPTYSWFTGPVEIRFIITRSE